MPPVQSVQPLIDPIGGIVSPLLVTGLPPVVLIQPLIGGLAGAAVTAAVPAPPTTPSGAGTLQRTMSISERAPSIESPQVEWAIKGPAKLKFTQLFNTTNRNWSDFLTGPQARNFMIQTKQPQANLAQIWALADMDSDGRFGCEEFVLPLHLRDLALQSEKVPAVLTPELVPPSFRKVTSRHGSLVGSRLGSVLSQGAPNLHAVPAEPLDPLSGLPQSSFEDKRKQNYDKGQVELDRRRKALDGHSEEEKGQVKNESYTSAWDTSNSWPVANDPVPAAQTTTVQMPQETLPNDAVETPTGFVKYWAIYEFSARNADEITFQPGDIIVVPLDQNAE